MENQRVYFDQDGQLVVETNNARVQGKEGVTTTMIQGTFEIDADSVQILLSHFNGKSLIRRRFSVFGSGEWETITSYEQMNDILGDYEKLYEKLRKIDCENKRLRRLIVEHNNKCRWFERKIKIEEK